MPGGSATKPGDIVTSMSGPDDRDPQHRRRRPPDPLRRASPTRASFKPRCVIDVATLTGACVVALGHVYTGLFSNDDDLAARAGRSGRARRSIRAWHLPLHEEYGEQLRSNFADFANIGRARRRRAASRRTSSSGSSTACRGRTSTSRASPGARTRTRARPADRCRCSSTSCSRSARAVTQVDFYIVETRLRGRAPQARLPDRRQGQRTRPARVHPRLTSDVEAQKLDELLWTFAQGSFIPHEIVRDEARRCCRRGPC